jgi:hypothetical protein
MEKPIDLLIVETKSNIAKVANESRLPLSILELIFKDLYTQVTKNLNEKVNEDIQAYNKALEEEAKKKEKEEGNKK